MKGSGLLTQNERVYALMGPSQRLNPISTCCTIEHYYTAASPVSAESAEEQADCRLRVDGLAPT